ncbi:MAG: TRAP transporter small permease [Rhodospirillales bacterium]|jgi:TRAP-type C4-dicarboxylate transport system permease small subunit|nr:TRAP transporter small permease [Rhodospirillales bacterium]
MRRAIEYYYRFLKLALTILMFLLMVPVSLQIFSSYIGFIPRYIWTEEMARFCFIWIILVGSMIAVRDGTHFTVDLLPPTVSKRTEALRNLFVDLCIAIAAAVFILWGEHFVASSLQQTSEMADMPMVFIYIAWPLAGVSYLVFLAEKTVDNVKLWRSAN